MPVIARALALSSAALALAGCPPNRPAPPPEFHAWAAPDPAPLGGAMSNLRASRAALGSLPSGQSQAEITGAGPTRMVSFGANTDVIAGGAQAIVASWQTGLTLTAVDAAQPLSGSILSRGTSDPRVQCSKFDCTQPPAPTTPTDRQAGTIMFVNCDSYVVDHGQTVEDAFYEGTAQMESCFRGASEVRADEFLYFSVRPPLRIVCDDSLSSCANIAVPPTAACGDPVEIRINPRKHTGLASSGNCGWLGATLAHEIMHFYMPSHEFTTQIFACEDWCFGNDQASKGCCLDPSDVSCLRKVEKPNLDPDPPYLVNVHAEVAHQWTSHGVSSDELFPDQSVDTTANDRIVCHGISRVVKRYQFADVLTAFCMRSFRRVHHVVQGDFNDTAQQICYATLDETDTADFRVDDLTEFGVNYWPPLLPGDSGVVGFSPPLSLGAGFDIGDTWWPVHIHEDVKGCGGGISDGTADLTTCAPELFEPEEAFTGGMELTPSSINISSMSGSQDEMKAHSPQPWMIQGYGGFTGQLNVTVDTKHVEWQLELE